MCSGEIDRKEETMSKKRQRFVKTLVDGAATAIDVSASALVLIYKAGTVLVNRTRKPALHIEKTGIESKISKSRIKLITLRYEIGKENLRLTWYGLLKQVDKR